MAFDGIPNPLLESKHGLIGFLTWTESGLRNSDTACKIDLGKK